MIQRNFFPGDKWVYFKIYLSPLSANDILINHIYPLVIQWMEEKVIDCWFFIRYADPDYHIRLRVELIDISFIGKIICEMKETLYNDISEQIISSIQLDTYKREVERYGEDYILECERFFQIDSTHVLDTIKINDTDDELIDISIKWLYNFLLSVNMSSPDILSFVSLMTMSYKREFRFSMDHIKILNLRYRGIRSKVEESIKSLYYRSLKNSKHFEWVKYGDGNSALLSSLIHMHFNRLFSNNQRIYEFIAYHFFYKAYDSVIKQISSKKYHE